MTTILRRHLLALMLGVTAITFAAPAFLDAPAFAKNGSDDNGSDDSDDDSSGSSGSDDDSDDDNGSSDDSDDDSSDDDDSDDDGDDSDDDSNGRPDKKDKKDKKAEKRADKSSARPTAVITLSAESLAAVRAGTSVVVDQLGRVLEVRVVTVNGQQVIRVKPHGGDARRNPGPITDIKVVPASSVPASDDGTPDQGSGDN